MGSVRRLHQLDAELRRRSRVLLRVIGGWRALWVTAIVLAALATAAASSAAPPPGFSQGPPPVFYPNIFPNEGIVGLTLSDEVTPYTSKGSGAIKIGRREIGLDFDFGEGTVAVVVHFDRQGVIDGISSNYSRLYLYGKPLAIGFDPMAARLKRRGWREGTCTRGHGHFAALGTVDQAHTYIVWTRHRVTVAISTAHSTFARTKADCQGISDASTGASR